MSWRRQLPREVAPQARKRALQQRPSKAGQVGFVLMMKTRIAPYNCHVLQSLWIPRF